MRSAGFWAGADKLAAAGSAEVPHLLAAEPVRPEAGVWLRAPGLGTGRGPGALRASPPPPQPPLCSALAPGGRRRASRGPGAPGLRRGGEECSGVCACSGDKSFGQDPAAGAVVVAAPPRGR